MQITERNYPALAKLKNGKLGKCDVHYLNYEILNKKPRSDRKETLMDYISVNWQINFEKYSKNVFYLCKSIESHFLKYVDAVCKMPEDVFAKEFWSKDHIGTIIYNGLVYCYELYKDTSGSIYVFQGNEVIYCMARGVDYLGKNILNNPRDFQDNMLHILFFLDHARVEVKEVGVGKKEHIDNEKWINNSRSPITVVDSLWFTTLVKSGAFNVSGHFRLQPYKDRKELIWIADFEKHGYTRKAKKLSFYPEEP